MNIYIQSNIYLITALLNIHLWFFREGIIEQWTGDIRLLVSIYCLHLKPGCKEVDSRVHFNFKLHSEPGDYDVLNTSVVKVLGTPVGGQGGSYGP